MVVGVPDFALLASDQTLRARARFLRCRHDPLAIVSRRASRKAIFAVLKRGAVVGKSQPPAGRDPLDRRGQIDLTSVDRAAA